MLGLSILSRKLRISTKNAILCMGKEASGSTPAVCPRCGDHLLPWRLIYDASNHPALGRLCPHLSDCGYILLESIKPRPPGFSGADGYWE